MQVSKRKFQIKKLSMAVAFAICGIHAPAMAATNLVTNGNFATPGLSGNWTSNRTSLGGWFSKNGAGVEIGASSIYGLPSISVGGQNLEVNANDFGDVYQMLDLKAGQNYLLTFYYGGRPDGGTQKLNVLAGGTLLNSVPLTGSYGAWTPQSFNFVAKSNREAIEFQSLRTNGRASYGNLVANVSVAAVPEPASWAMMIVGIGGIGGVLRRRNRGARLARA